MEEGHPMAWFLLAHLPLPIQEEEFCGGESLITLLCHASMLRLRDDGLRKPLILLFHSANLLTGGLKGTLAKIIKTMI